MCVQVGTNFTVAAPLAYTTNPSTPSIWQPMTVTVEGVGDFAEDDDLSLRCDDCGNALLEGLQPSLMGTGPSRTVGLRPVALCNRTIVCLSRGGRAHFAVGEPFTVGGVRDFDLSPSPVIREEVHMFVPYPQKDFSRGGRRQGGFKSGWSYGRSEEQLRHKMWRPRDGGRLAEGGPKR